MDRPRRHDSLKALTIPRPAIVGTWSLWYWGACQGTGRPGIDLASDQGGQQGRTAGEEESTDGEGRFPGQTAEEDLGAGADRTPSRPVTQLAAIARSASTIPETGDSISTIAAAREPELAAPAESRTWVGVSTPVPCRTPTANAEPGGCGGVRRARHVCLARTGTLQSS